MLSLIEKENKINLFTKNLKIRKKRKTFDYIEV